MKKLLVCVIAAATLCGCVGKGEKMDKNLCSGGVLKNLRTDAPALRFPVIVPIYGNDDETLSKTRALIKHIHETAGVNEFAVSLPLYRGQLRNLRKHLPQSCLQHHRRHECIVYSGGKRRGYSSACAGSIS